jgi:hypothetical protein
MQGRFLLDSKAAPPTHRSSRGLCCGTLGPLSQNPGSPIRVELAAGPIRVRARRFSHRDHCLIDFQEVRDKYARGNEELGLMENLWLCRMVRAQGRAAQYHGAASNCASAATAC